MVISLGGGLEYIELTILNVLEIIYLVTLIFSCSISF